MTLAFRENTNKSSARPCSVRGIPCVHEPGRGYFFAGEGECLIIKDQCHFVEHGQWEVLKADLAHSLGIDTPVSLNQPAFKDINVDLNSHGVGRHLVDRYQDFLKYKMEDSVTHNQQAIADQGRKRQRQIADQARNDTDAHQRIADAAKDRQQASQAADAARHGQLPAADKRTQTSGPNKTTMRRARKAESGLTIIDFVKKSDDNPAGLSNCRIDKVSGRKKCRILMKAKELSDVDVNFVSLVNRPANRIPFRILKSVEPCQCQSTKMGKALTAALNT